MPLDRDHVTSASLIMLPAYVILAVVFGLVYVFDPGGRVDGVHALAAQREVMPLAVWGVMFLCLAGLMCLALATRSRTLFSYALAVAAVSWFTWGCLYLASVFVDPAASVISPFPAWFVATACIASMVSLVRREGA